MTLGNRERLVQTMAEEPLVQIKIPKKGEKARRPPWMRVKVGETPEYREVARLVKDLKLNTVCQEARCPNIWECWGEHRTATFMIMGDICTRACRYCDVTSGKPGPLDASEPGNVAEAVCQMGLRHAVITSVDRDDLPDFGALHWVETILAIKRGSPECAVEVLTPDFGGSVPELLRVLDARPDVFSHNIETVRRLHPKMRSKGDYVRTLEVLRRAHEYRSEGQVAMNTKTGLMLGLGETLEEVLEVFDDLRGVHCDVLTMGQYLNPTHRHAPIHRFYPPSEFEWLKEEAIKRGFKHVESGPLVRSSYHAHEHGTNQ